MAIAVSGSIATDHLMHFSGRFAEQLLPDQLANLSLSFLVDKLDVRRGGAGANIAFAMSQLGLRPVLIGGVGEDFGDYRAWLERSGVDCESVAVSDLAYTARFVCTTDDDMSQLASFYPGAMAKARDIELAPIAARVGGFDVVVISPNDPAAMLRHTEECRDAGYPFAADPSQQIAFMDGPDLIRLIDGATYLFTNEYESKLLESKTGLDAAEMLTRVDTRITTLGERGSVIERRDQEPIRVPAATVVDDPRDPTGVGDAFRGGFLAATSWGLPTELAARVGHMMAAYVLEAAGAQEYDVRADSFLERFTDSYGPEAAAEVRAKL